MNSPHMFSLDVNKHTGTRENQIGLVSRASLSLSLIFSFLLYFPPNFIYIFLFLYVQTYILFRK